MKPDVTLEAPPGWERVAVVSDLHLGPDAPRTVECFLDWLRNDALGADALFILGDLFEAWIGDEQCAMEPDSAEHRVCEALAALHAHGCKVAVQRGNRDFLLGETFARTCGIDLLPDPSLLNLGGERIVLTHGDALCVSDQAYQQWRAVCRDPAWQARFLALPVEERLRQASAARAQSRASQATMETLVDADAAQAEQWLRDADSTWMIHGHTHRPKDHWRDGRLRQVLADWDLDHADAPRAQILWLESAPHWIGVRRQTLCAA